MTISVDCPKCSLNFIVDRSFAGGTVQCPRCANYNFVSPQVILDEERFERDEEGVHYEKKRLTKTSSPIGTLAGICVAIVVGVFLYYYRYVDIDTKRQIRNIVSDLVPNESNQAMTSSQDKDDGVLLPMLGDFFSLLEDVPVYGCSEVCWAYQAYDIHPILYPAWREVQDEDWISRMSVAWYEKNSQSYELYRREICRLFDEGVYPDPVYSTWCGCNRD